MTIGLDIGSKTIKIVELEKQGQSMKLLASGIIGYDGPSLDKISQDAQLGGVANLIRKLAKEARVGGKEVALSLPEQLVFTRTIKFPLLSDAEVASAVKWEAEQYIPMPINEAIIQHIVLSRDEAANQTVVLLVAAPRTVAEKYTKLVQMAGLSPVQMETELIALCRSLAPKDRTCLIIDLGAGSTDIAIAKNGSLYFSRSLATAGEAFTRSLSQTLSITVQQAEEYKKTYGLSSQQLEGKVKGALEPVVASVVDEIKKAVHYYQSEEKGQAPTSVILTGGSSFMPEAISFFSQLLGLEIEIGNPFANIAMSEEAAKVLKNYAPLYAVAVGLALYETSY